MRRLLPVLCLFFALPASAQVSADLAETYLDASALPTLVGTVGGQIGQQLQFQSGQFPEPAQGPFLEIYTEALSAESLAERLRAFVTAEGEADSLEAAAAWYQTPLVGEMQALEQATAEDDNAQVAMQMYAMTGSFPTIEITPEREAQADRYFALSGGTDATVDLYLDIIVASQMSTAALSDEAPPPADSIRARMRPMLESNIGSAVRGSTLYAFRDVPDEDFETYLGLLEVPAAQYALRLNQTAVSTALVGAITEAGETFAQTLLAPDAAGEIDLDEMRGGDEEPEMEDEMDSDG